MNDHSDPSNSAQVLPEGARSTSDDWQNFFVSLILHLGLPLLPLLLEKWFSGAVEGKSVALTAALYSMAIGLSSRRVGIFGCGIAICIVFSAVFGFLSREPTLVYAKPVAYGAIGWMFMLHSVERFRRHVRRRKPFFEFLVKE